MFDELRESFLNFIYPRRYENDIQLKKENPFVDGVGYVYYLKNIDDPSIPGSNKKLVKFTQTQWLNDLKQTGTRFEVKCIFGEVKELTFMEMVLEDQEAFSLCDSFILIFGDKIWNQISKNKLKDLLDKYSDKFSAFRYSERPEDHGIMISDKIMLESRHALRETYKDVQVIEKASEPVQKNFEEEFYRLYSGTTQVTLNNISGLQLYNPN
jgi:hypothetical protein